MLEIGGGISAAFATHFMAGFGADVVRTEGPAGVMTSDEEIYLLPGKRRVTAGHAELQHLAMAADIIVEDGRPGAMAGLGLDPEMLRREKPGLVIVSISPFGQTGPYAQYEATNIVSFAMGGLMSLTGSPSREPLVNGGSQALYLGGMNGFGAGVTAYYGSLISGEGDWIDISLQECMAGMLELYGPMSASTGSPGHLRSGNHLRATWGIYPCVDGFIGICALERQVPALFKLAGVPDEERFTDPYQRPEHDDELQAVMYQWAGRYTKEEILAFSPKYKVPLGAVLTPNDLLESENLRERGAFDTIECSAGKARVPGRPFEGIPWAAGELHEPGADTATVLSDWREVGA